MKHASKGLSVPGYSAPSADNHGWMYSSEMVSVLIAYKEKFPWVIAALEGKAGSEGDGPGALAGV